MTAKTKTQSSTQVHLNVRSDFPAIQHDPTLVYADSAATTLKPNAVISEVNWFLSTGTSAIYRGVHGRSVEATERFKDARATIANWFNVSSNQVVFTSGSTAAINLVRLGLLGLKNVLTTKAEHHSNLLPWKRGLRSRVLTPNPWGLISARVLDDELQKESADLVAVTHVGNVLGTKQPIAELAEVAHRHGSLLLVDAAQSASHLPSGVDELAADFVVCSGHKMLGPSGIGALIATPEALERLTPVFWGGGMVTTVENESISLQLPPQKFEAGTPPIESVLGWAAAIEYLDSLGRENVHAHIQSITELAQQQLATIPAVELFGQQAPNGQNGIISFRIEGWESHAAARVLSQRFNICVRSGFHCAELLHQSLDLAPTLRASFHVYSNGEDVGKLVDAVQTLSKLNIG